MRLKLELQNPSLLNEELKEDKSRSSGRLLYEAQVEVIKKQIGDLEFVRTSLGLSQRKICQLLMVDPSAWTRWQKSDAPPHIYRSLQWYLALKDKIPGLTPYFFIGRETAKNSLEFDDLKHANLELRASITRLQKHQKTLSYATLALTLLSLGLLSIGAYLVVLGKF